jgi:starch phosphorylase
MTTVKDLAEMFPERFSNKTNGVTPRRWLLMANTALANLVTTAIGEAWITNLAELGRLKPLVNDTGFLDAFQKASLQAKGVFADVLRAKYGETVDPDTIFDSQVKRIHEYKRQLLNVLRIVVHDRRIRGPDLERGAVPGLLRKRTLAWRECMV